MSELSDERLVASWPYSRNCEIRVRVVSWKKERRVDVRLYLLDDFGEALPTRKGISIPVADVGKLRAALDGLGEEKVGE